MWHTLWLITLGFVALWVLCTLPIFVHHWVKDMHDNVKGRGVYGKDD